MSDLISRESLLEEIKENRWGWFSKELMLRILENQPSVDAVPVVRCKNCEHWGTGFAGETEHVKCCKIAIYMVGENGYCVYGELRSKTE